ncbi:MAG: GNAT family N-acetyltransferase [Synechococcales cyanobacterium]
MRVMQTLVTSYADHQAEIMAVRETVFVREQGVPAELEMDDRDPECCHVLALDGDKAVGTGRIDLQKHGKIGRLAVLKAYRGQGVGRLLMEALETLARQHGIPSIQLSAQVTALPFYEKLGYEVISEEYMDAGISHRTMRKALTERNG